MTWVVRWTLMFTFLSRSFSRSEKQPRIHNGDDADAGEFPFVAQVLADTEFDNEGVITQNLCGGSIIAKNMILTAAHCVVRDVSGLGWEQAQDQIYHPVQLGVWTGDLTQYESDNQQFGYVKAIIVHENYNSLRVVNDIALIVLEDDLRFDKYTTKISLPEDDGLAGLYAKGSPVTVVGWGFTEEGRTAHILQKLSYEMASREECKESYGEQILPGMMCTGVKPMEKRSAIGDSGGPLFTKVAKKWVQLGVVSWGAGDPDESAFDVNTDVSYFKSWILTAMSRITFRRTNQRI